MVVTGGGRGIGAATALLAAERGFSVCVNYLKDKDSAVSLVKKIKKGIAVQADVSSEADVVRMFDEVDRQLGRVTALVNNAGIVDRGMRVESMTAARIAFKDGAKLMKCRIVVRRVCAACAAMEQSATKVLY